MSLNPGTRIGPYEIVGLVGAGGMGEVYRAKDTKLNRDVAIKVLPESFALDADRVARFTREAQVLASLNHPNIAAIYGIESGSWGPGVPGSSVTQALVMELVEGEDLSAHIARGAMPLAEALPIARQIADALEAAHEQGIVHRDLKPQNIKVRADGTVKVLDFGLAKATDPRTSGLPDPDNSPTLTARATQVGVVLGTAAYMAPEQAKGRAVDKRADIWAFGVVLYEMLTGRRLFGAEDISETLAAVLTRDVSVTSMPEAVPPRLRALVRDCLIRDPKQRLRDIGDARLVLDKIIAGVPDDVAVPTLASVVAFPAWRHALPWAIAAALAIALVGALSGVFTRSTPSAPLRRFTLSLPSKFAPNWGDFRVAISSNGDTIAYTCRDGNKVSMCVKPLDSLDARPVADARDADEWFFSPDGEWIGMADRTGLSKVSVRGGAPQVIYRWPIAETAPYGFSWGADDHILFGTASGVQRVSAAGGAAEVVTRIAEGSGVVAHQQPSHLPGGRGALVTLVRADGGDTAGLIDLSDGSIRDLGIHGHGFVYVAPGWLAYQQGTTIMAIAFDPANPTRQATPVPVVEKVTDGPHVAGDGTLVYVPTRGESSARLVWVDRDGRPTPVAGDRLDYEHLDLAPDGRRALLNLESGSVDLIDLQSGTRKVVGSGAFPVWSPNGERVTFRGTGGLVSAPVDGSAPPELVVKQDASLVPTSWNAVTGDLAYYDQQTFDLWIRTADGQTHQFLKGPGRKRSGRFSPDGKWLAFVNDETNDYQVYVTAYPGPGPTVAVSTKGGLSPIWSGDGRELFFRIGTKVFSSRMTSAAPVGFSPPSELFDGPYTLDLRGHQREDVSTDGRRFLMVENSDDFPIVIVQNWLVELKRVVR